MSWSLVGIIVYVTFMGAWLAWAMSIIFGG